MPGPEQREQLRQAGLAPAARAELRVHEPAHQLALLVVADRAVRAELVGLVEADPGIEAGLLEALLQAARPLRLLAPAAGQLPGGVAPGHHARPQHENVLHVGREALVKPEQLEGVLPAVVEGPEHGVVEPLHIPGVEELVGHQLVERVVALGLVEGRAVRDQAGAVTVLQAAPQPRREGEQEHIAAEGEAPEEGALGLDDILGGLGDAGLIAVVRPREDQLEGGAAGLEAPRPEGTQLEGGVHQGVEVRRAVGALRPGQRRGHLPGRGEALELDLIGPVQLAFQVEESRRGNELRVAGIHVVGAHGELVAVDPVGEGEALPGRWQSPGLLAHLLEGRLPAARPQPHPVQEAGVVPHQVGAGRPGGQRRHGALPHRLGRELQLHFEEMLREVQGPNRGPDRGEPGGGAHSLQVSPARHAASAGSPTGARPR